MLWRWSYDRTRVCEGSDREGGGLDVPDRGARKGSEATDPSYTWETSQHVVRSAKKRHSLGLFSRWRVVIVRS